MDTLGVEKPDIESLGDRARNGDAPETFDLLGFRAVVTASPGEASDAVRAIMRGFPSVESSVGDASPFSLTAAAEGQWQVGVKGETVFTSDNLSTALAALEWHIVTTALRAREDLFHLHGASLCAPARRAGLMLVGGSGNGKTTLALGLMLHGFTPFGDDVALLDPGSLELQPFRRAFHVADDTWQLLTSVSGPIARDSAPAGYFSPPQWAESPVPVRWLLFVELRRVETPELVRLSAGEAATAILGQTISLAGSPRVALSTAARLTEQAHCYRFVTGDLGESIAAIQRLVATSDPAPNQSPRG